MDIETRMLVTRSEITLWQQGQPGPVFGGSAIYHGAPSAGGDPVESMRQQMREAVAHTMKLAALDIAQPASQGDRPRQPFTIKTSGNPVTLQVESLGTEASHTFFRSAEGAMFSVQR
jgi:hypothetical protein